MKRKLSSLCLAVSLALPLVAVTALTGVTGCAGNRYDRSTGEYIDDKAISMRVKSALEDSHEYKFDGVNVTTFRGTVQLSGFVNTSDQRRKAAEIAREIEGVRTVENNITVKS